MHKAKAPRLRVSSGPEKVCEDPSVGERSVGDELFNTLRHVTHISNYATVTAAAAGSVSLQYN